MPGSATYPSWHPGGKYVAYSSNQVRQNFYSHRSRNIEVFDLVSTLILYDLDKNEVMNIRETDTAKYLQTFPSWSPDGKYLYYCRAHQTNADALLSLENIKNTRYNLVRIPFNADTRTFGETEVVFNAEAAGKSVSFPRISPDGKYLILTVADYGTFPIWHKEADLYIINLQNNEIKKMDINSDETESYHSWSLNGKWLVFSSKRVDGRSARPYFVYFDSWEKTGKPFVMPQKDPTLYNMMVETYNIPEFVNGKINLNPRDFYNASRETALKAKSATGSDSLSLHEVKIINQKRNPGEKSIHE